MSGQPTNDRRPSAEWILGRRGREALCLIARDPFALIALDLEGALARGSGDRPAATTMELLRRVGCARRVAVASSLPVDELRQAVAGIDAILVSEAHGCDLWTTLRDRTPITNLLYVGGFVAGDTAFDRIPRATLKVAVGSRGGSGARFYLEHQTQIDDLLRGILSAAPEWNGRPGCPS